jgi:hypothetical protein
MTPRVPDWTEEQTAEFLADLEYVRANLSAPACKRELKVSRQTMNLWAGRTCAPGAENREAVVSLADRLRKSLNRA